MNLWFYPWWGLLKSPLSGDVVQDINPITSLFSPQIELNFAGNRRIETEVVTGIASYGRQIGILSEAILELASDEKGEAIERLKALTADIEKIKNEHKVSLKHDVKAGLDKLQRQDPATLKRLLDEYI